MSATPRFSAHTSAEGHTIDLAGELDIAAVPALHEKIARLCGEGTPEVVIDLSRLRFIDSAGLRLMLTAQSLCEANGCRLRLIPGPPNVQRVFEISGLLEHLPFAA